MLWSQIKTPNMNYYDKISGIFPNTVFKIYRGLPLKLVVARPVLYYTKN